MMDHLYKADELAVYEFLECGALGHPWDFVDSNHWTAPFGVPVTRRCMRCGTERRQCVMRDERTILAERYIYPPGYKFAKGERPSRMDFMLMAIDSKRRRKVKKDTTFTATVPTAQARREVKNQGK
jgi:hypothetical protein